jgi:hypothetical protein
MLNHHLSQKLKLIGMNAFNHLIYIITYLDTSSKVTLFGISNTGMCHCQRSVQEMEFILQFKP